MLLIAFLQGKGAKARAYSCRTCGSRLCSDHDAIAVGGHPARAIFINPVGVACEIMTFRSAENLLGADFTTEEYSWFEGYSWRPLACSNCRAHVGWSYEAVEPDLDPKGFYGLLAAALRAGPDRGRDM